MIKLKLCPFCGSPAQIEPWHGGPPTKVLISCSNEYCKVGPSVCGDTEKEAVKIWNYRPQNIGIEVPLNDFDDHPKD